MDRNQALSGGRGGLSGWGGGGGGCKGQRKSLKQGMAGICPAIWVGTSWYRSIQNNYPRKIMISELIRRGVIFYAGNFLPQINFVELIMRGNSVSHHVDRLFWGVKNYSKESNGNYFLCGAISELPHKIVFELIGE